MDQNLGTSTVSAAIAEATGVSKARLSELYKDMGDLGDVAQSCRRTQGLLVAPVQLTVARVYGAIEEALKRESTHMGGGKTPCLQTAHMTI